MFAAEPHEMSASPSGWVLRAAPDFPAERSGVMRGARWDAPPLARQARNLHEGDCDGSLRVALMSIS